jgi:antitoxin ParD1/3/4
MAKNTSILFGDYFEDFINKEIESQKFSSKSEVIRTALRIYEQEKKKLSEVFNELEIGLKRKKIRNFDKDKNLEQLKAEFFK